MKNLNQIIQFHNCYIMRDGRVIREDLWTKNGKIINPEPLFFDEKNLPDARIDCGNILISPGFIDVQLNGGFGIDFSDPNQNIDKGLKRVAKGILPFGTTSFCPTLVTSPPEFYHKILKHIQKTPGSTEGAEILGVHAEGPFISTHKKGAHNLNYIHLFTNAEQTIEEVYGPAWKNITMITLAPELQNSAEVINYLVKNGVTVSLGHSMGSLPEGEKAVCSGASLITHLFNAMLPFHHRDPSLIGLLASTKIPSDRTVYYGIIADGIHTHPAALRIAYRTHPDGIVLVTDAMSALGLEPGHYSLGSQNVDVTERCAYILGTTTLAGSIVTMDKCVRHFKESAGCSVVQALEAATLHPARALGIDKKKGTLNFGADADFVFLDGKLNVLSTWIASECVYHNPSNNEPSIELVDKAHRK
uniref:N-acetylglucosamine-6-phosphate deacetylase n=1 Tax=Evadne anonyx TaxID=141404 RepID=A0A9N6WQ16_9CRUS|nr:EOG090X06GX [Evadne anonyx]